jgi:hypothetical protein
MNVMEQNIAVRLHMTPFFPWETLRRENPPPKDVNNYIIQNQP